MVTSSSVESVRTRVVISILPLLLKLGVPVLWLMKNRDVSGLFNLGTGRAQTWLELMRALYAAVGQDLQVDWVDTPEEIRDQYQYFTQANMQRLRAAGYDRPFKSVEQGVADYVEQHLSQADPYR